MKRGIRMATAKIAGVILCAAVLSYGCGGTAEGGGKGAVAPDPSTEVNGPPDGANTHEQGGDEKPAEGGDAKPADAVPEPADEDRPVAAPSPK
jgi:hypothetical protein